MSYLLRAEMSSQSDVLEAMHENAAKNAAASGGLFTVYPINWDGDSDQTLGTFGKKVIVGNPLSKDKMFELAAAINPAFKGLENLFYTEENAPAVEDMAITARTGGSYCVATDHQELTGIAVIGGGLGAIHRENVPNYKNGLILNKSLLSFLGIAPEIVSHLDTVIGEEREQRGVALEGDGSLKLQEFLKLVFDFQYPVIPNTNSFSEIRGVQGKVISFHNELLMRSIEGNMTNLSISRRRNRVGNGLFAVLSGTKNKPLDVDEWRNTARINSYDTFPSHDLISEEVTDIDVMGRISKRTIDYLRHSRTYAATAGFRSSNDFKIKINSRARAIIDVTDLDNLAGDIVSLATETFGKQVIYDKKGNAPLQST